MHRTELGKGQREEPDCVWSMTLNGSRAGAGHFDYPFSHSVFLEDLLCAMAWVMSGAHRGTNSVVPDSE